MGYSCSPLDCPGLPEECRRWSLVRRGGSACTLRPASAAFVLPSMLSACLNGNMDLPAVAWVALCDFLGRPQPATMSAQSTGPCLAEARVYTGLKPPSCA